MITTYREKYKDIKVGLALGAGGFRGMSHIGILQVFEEEGIPIRMVSGCSMGSIIAAIYACGTPVDMMEKIACSLSDRELFDLTMPRMGFVKGDKMESVVKTLTADRSFQDIAFPLAIIAAELCSDRLVTFKTGDEEKLARAVRASCAIPGIFAPVPYKEDGLLVDGGMLVRVPLEQCRMLGADVVIGVDVAFRGWPQQPKNVIDIIASSIDLLQWEVTKLLIKPDDLVITPDVQRFDPMHPREQEACIQEGRKAAKAMLPEIYRRLDAAVEALHPEALEG
nr:patatin-like phospholipase family protein [Maliibacterium massiliense]